MNFATRALLDVLAKFAPHAMPKMPEQEVHKPQGGWVEIIMDLGGREMKKADWCHVLDGGHIMYEVRLAMAIRDELMARCNTAPNLEQIYMWESMAAGHTDYSTKLARKCYEFEMAVVRTIQ